ncbi:hypothetical protein ACFL0Q_04265 [Thermodesulfobacteriota bacterium]
MRFASFIHKKLIDLLKDRRIVVWYDSEGDFKAFATSFDATQLRGAVGRSVCPSPCSPPKGAGVLGD